MTVFDAQCSSIRSRTNQETKLLFIFMKKKKIENPDLRRVNYMALGVWYSNDSRHSIVFIFHLYFNLYVIIMSQTFNRLILILLLFGNEIDITTGRGPGKE